jgi:basic membrane protein A
VALLAAACGSSTSKAGSGSSSSSSGGAATSAAPKGCMVTDTGGINDRSFNASSWLGMESAQKADPSKITPYPKGIKYLQSLSASNYTPNIGALLGQKCGIIFTVGFDMGPATQTAAKAHPSQHFAIVDFNYTPPLKNVDGLLFNTVQAAFLGGYLAAGMTKTGKVATFGGQNIPPVTIYMDGFWDGVQYYNAKHHTHVQVLGWNEVTQKGSFTGDFTNTTKGETLTGTFLTEGADIILPVAGQVGLGAAKAVQLANARGFKANMEWVDTDGCISAPQYCQYFITSVEKGITTAVKTAFLANINGTFTGGTYIGTLANGGVGIAPFHDFASKVPASLQAELAAIKHAIEMGTIKTPTHAGV